MIAKDKETLTYVQSLWDTSANPIFAATLQSLLIIIFLLYINLFVLLSCHYESPLTFSNLSVPIMCVCLTLHTCMLSGVTGVQWPFTHQCLKQPWKNSNHSRAIRRTNRRTLPSSACILTSPATSSVSSTIRYSHLLSCAIPDSLCADRTLLDLKTFYFYLPFIQRFEYHAVISLSWQITQMPVPQ